MSGKSWFSTELPQWEEFEIPADAMFDLGIVGSRTWDFGRRPVYKMRCGCILFERDDYSDWWNFYAPGNHHGRFEGRWEDFLMFGL